jgi:hypothetical protein
MQFPFGETVTLHARGLTWQDEDGNDVSDPTRDVVTTLTGVPVWPRNASEGRQGENTQGSDMLITGLSALLPAGTVVTAIDKVDVYGQSYEIDGEPGRYQSPFTGTNPGVLVNLTRITG